MVTLDMTKKTRAIRIDETAFSPETGILTLQISLGDYDLTGKTVTATFNETGVETGYLSVVSNVIQLPITTGLVASGTNHIQLNIREGLTLEQSPIMEWYVLEPVTGTDPAPTDVDIITALLNTAQETVERAEAAEAVTGADVLLTAADVVATGEDRAAVEAALSTFTGTTLPAAVAEVEAEGDAQILLVQAEGTTQKGLVAGEGTTQVNRVIAEGDTQDLRVTGEGTTQVGLVQAEGVTQIGLVGDEGDAQILLVQGAGTTQIGLVQAEGVTQVGIVEDEGDAQVLIVQNAGANLQSIIDNAQIGSLDDLKTTTKLTLVDAINENSLAFSRIAAPKYGVSGVGGSAPALTKLWDLVGKSVAVGTDLAGATNDLDTLAPFNRRKCVGTWISGANEAIFVPQSYYGDPDYAEDGSKGDYVAVDIEPFWWYESSDGSTIGVSPGPQYGWEIHPICVNKRTGIVRDHTYIPAFALALKDGKAVSLPGYRNERGNYKTLWDAAKTYDGTAKQYAILEPSEIDHYEWLLQTIEFATTNPQTVMRGAVDVRYSDDPITALTPTTGVVSATAGAAFVIGQNVYIGTSYSADVQASHKIDNIEACDETGNTAGTGYYLLTMTPYAGATDITTITTPKITTRPWSTGACSGVLSPSGSPVSNSSGKYPARYRWRENPYGNQNMTCVDLMSRLTGGNLEWYYLSDPLAYYPADVNKPDEAVLIAAGSAWTKLAVTPENYADGYIKKRGSDPALKHIKVPTLTAGASDNTYFSDYAYLVNSPLVRSVRRRGHTSYGSHAGPCFVIAKHAPGNSYWYYGGALFMVQ